MNDEVIAKYVRSHGQIERARNDNFAVETPKPTLVVSGFKPSPLGGWSLQYCFSYMVYNFGARISFTRSNWEEP